MGKRSDIDWFAPTAILVSLALGVLFAIGHHLFCSSLDGNPASGNDYSIAGSNVSQQQLNVAVGTAFTFLVRASLASAVSIAYVQLLWRALKRSSRQATLDALDTVFAAPTSVFRLFKVKVWWHYPLLFLLAAIIW